MCPQCKHFVYLAVENKSNVHISRFCVQRFCSGFGEGMGVVRRRGLVSVASERAMWVFDYIDGWELHSVRYWLHLRLQEPPATSRRDCLHGLARGGKPVHAHGCYHGQEPVWRVCPEEEEASHRHWCICDSGRSPDHKKTKTATKAETVAEQPVQAVEEPPAVQSGIDTQALMKQISEMVFGQVGQVRSDFSAMLKEPLAMQQQQAIQQQQQQQAPQQQLKAMQQQSCANMTKAMAPPTQDPVGEVMASRDFVSATPTTAQQHAAHQHVKTGLNNYKCVEEFIRVFSELPLMAPHRRRHAEGKWGIGISLRPTLTRKWKKKQKRLYVTQNASDSVCMRHDFGVCTSSSSSYWTPSARSACRPRRRASSGSPRARTFSATRCVARRPPGTTWSRFLIRHQDSCTYGTTYSWTTGYSISAHWSAQQVQVASLDRKSQYQLPVRGQIEPRFTLHPSFAGTYRGARGVAAGFGVVHVHVLQPRPDLVFFVAGSNDPPFPPQSPRKIFEHRSGYVDVALVFYSQVHEMLALGAHGCWLL